MDVIPSATYGEYTNQWKIIDNNFNVVEYLDDDVYVNEMEEHTTDFSAKYIRTIDSEADKMGFVWIEKDLIHYDCTVSGHVEGEWLTYGNTEKYVPCIKCGEVVKIDNSEENAENDIKDTVENVLSDIEKWLFEHGLDTKSLLVGGAVVIVLVLIISILKARRRK